MTDAELVALGALVQADAVDIECENKAMMIVEESHARVNNQGIRHVHVRSVYDMASYQRLVEELRKREVLL